MNVNEALEYNTAKGFHPFLNKILKAVIAGLIFKYGLG